MTTGPMMRVTAETTLGELAVILGALGVEHIQVKIDSRTQRAYVAQVRRRFGTEGSLSRALIQALRGSIGSGVTLYAAIDDAISRFLHRSAEGLEIRDAK